MESRGQSMIRRCGLEINIGFGGFFSKDWFVLIED